NRGAAVEVGCPGAPHGRRAGADGRSDSERRRVAEAAVSRSEVEGRRADRRLVRSPGEAQTPALLEPGDTVAGEAERVHVAAAERRPALPGAFDRDEATCGGCPGGHAPAGDE